MMPLPTRSILNKCYKGKAFRMVNFFGYPTSFSEDEAPSWLTGKNTVLGSTMDQRWFWRDHVLTLEVGQSIETDFRTITRIN